MENNTWEDGVRRDFEEVFVANYPYDYPKEVLIEYGVFRKSGDIYTSFETEQMWKGYLARARKDREEVDVLKQIHILELGLVKTENTGGRSTGIVSAEVYFENRKLNEEIQQLRALLLEAVSLAGGLRGYEKIQTWLEKVKKLEMMKSSTW